MCLFYNRRLFVIQLIEILLLLLTDHNGRLTLTKESTTVAAAVNQRKNSTALLPYLQIQRLAITRLTISKPHTPYYLPCIPILTPYNYDQDNQPIYCSWYRNDVVVEQTSYRKNDFFIYENGTLRLPTNEKASGVYHCKIEWDESAVISDRITVEYPVLKRLFPGQQQTANITAVENKPLVLSCPFLSVPPARFSWYFGNDSLTNDNSALTLSNGTLILRQLRPEQAGKYKCVAQNVFAGKPHRQFTWQLRVESKDNPYYPKNEAGIPETPVSEAQLLPAFQNATVFVPTGGSVLLQCHAVADFVPIDWYLQTPNNKLIRLSNNSVAYSITNASVSRHEGRYSCITLLESQNFQVIVTTPPRIVSRLPVEVVYIGLSRTLTCRAEGHPEPSISWYHNGVQLNSSYTRYINGNELHVHSFDSKEEGIYQCVAKNVAGEDSATGELRFNRQLEEVNPLQNIRCYPHSFHSINVTFDSRTLTSMFVVYIVRSNPHSWTSFSPMKLNQTSYVVISTSLPVYEPFALITRVLLPTTEVRSANAVPQQMILSSLRSTPVICCTQGLMLRPIAVGNDTFVKWSQGQLDNKKYFILQFSINHTHPHPSQLLNDSLLGTVTSVEEKADEVRSHLTKIQPLNQSAAATVLRNVEHEDNVVDDVLELEEDIFSLVVDASVTGMLLQRFTRIKMRVLVITTENEFLGQDFRYVQWKIIENGTSEQANMPFRLVSIESRALAFKFLDSLNATCVSACHNVIPVQMSFPRVETDCNDHNISNSMLWVTKLKADVRYNLRFYNCKTQIFYGEIDVKTEQDPPGTISNSKLIKQNGLKLTWEPPVNPNGCIHHYDIRWSLDNVTHEAIVKDCVSCSYKFPNVSETDKIHVAVRVVGDTGAGAPMYFDMINNNHTWLEKDPLSHSEVYSGIAIGSLLSIACVFLFGLFIIFQQRNFKARAQGPTHLTTPTDINFGNLSSASGMPGDSAGGLSGGTLQQDCHEMQTLIPRSRYHIELLPEHTLEYQTSSAAVAVVHLANGNGNVQVARRSDQDGTAQGDLGIAGVHNLSQLPLCGGGGTSPERKTVQDAMLQEAKAFFIPYRHTPPNAVALGSSKQCGVAGGSELEVIVPPNSLPLVNTMPGLGVTSGGGGSGGGGGGSSSRRSGSLSSSSASSSSNGSSKKQFHTNFVRHSNSNDGICLLAEEEAAATLTPTSEREYAAVCLTNGFNLPADVAKSGGGSQYTTTNNNNSNSTSQKSTTAKERQPRGNGNPISFSHNAFKVPANGPSSVNVNHSSAVKQSWPAATVVHRRAQVDPNG
ncbi:uncharacterized protein LOC108113583 [Drosophila eugracilis]|uniref:uncharacterized protein LOC108113583 n=1 Tax=Drosophila eugracilis TaxID=29029 RepID=UPI0007E8037B|nr:uncharacterized protein LOC108113583 [Drosophila eugracilis]XP_017079715.1 uncharacterized protein LOC108113583 [Drosophila eugracilis]XP_017079716.1 uncharacterized protein LOC108113583 [Drosophila eugracilis]